MRSPRLVGAAVLVNIMLAMTLFAMTATAWREFRLPHFVGGYDWALNNQYFYLAVHGGGWLHSTLQDTIYHGDLLATHFSPIFYVFLPLYAVWPSPLMLLALASLGVATCGVALFFIARRLFQNDVVALIWCALFALYPPVAWSLPDSQFHEIFVGVGFLSLALLFYIEENYRVFFPMLIAAILSKEDVALLLPAWGLVARLQGRDRRLAASIAFLGVAYFLAVNAIIMPALRGHDPGSMIFSGLPTPLGNSFAGIVHTVYTAPWELLRLIASRQNISYWIGIFSPLLFLPLLGWEYLAIPAYVYVALSIAPTLQANARHVFPAIPFVFVAAMMGTTRALRFVGSIRSLPVVGSQMLRRGIGLAVLLCAVSVSTLWHTPYPALLHTIWPDLSRPVEGVRLNTPLFDALTRIPPQASLAATRSLIVESSSRDRLYWLGPVFSEMSFEQSMERNPDYVAVELRDLNERLLRHQVAPLLCRGTYGVVYVDGMGYGRMLLRRGAELSANRMVNETFLPAPHQPCPPGVERIPAPYFRDSAMAHARGAPSAVWSNDMLLGPVTAVAANRFAQDIDLPDHIFEPGSYRFDLTGAGPWSTAPASYRLTARLLVGGRLAGEGTTGGDRPLRYTTSPFHVDRRERLPMRVHVEIAEGRERGMIRVFSPNKAGCAVVEDAPNLNPQQVTVEALIYLEGMPRTLPTEPEAPILSKGSALGYYLRFIRDDQGKVWADFNVAGRWALGRAGAGMVPFHRWTMVAATYDGREAKIYVNGRQAVQGPSRSPRYAGMIRSGGVPLVIGCRDLDQPDQVEFPGLIRMVRVWNRTLTAREVDEESVTGSISTDRRGLVGDWEFQTVNAGVIPDLSGAGNPIVNGGQLVRIPSARRGEPFRAWHARELNLLHRVSVRFIGR